MSTRVRFEGTTTFRLTEQAITAFAGYSTPAGWSFRGSFGALVNGTLDRDSTAATHDLHPGIVGALAVSRHSTFGDGAWFVTGSFGISILVASTTENGVAAAPVERFIGGDARLGAIAGRTFANVWNPYLLARGFGGPILWSVDGMDASGTDTRHFQLGAGLSVVTSFGLTLVVDISALGEQSASLGASWRL